MQREICTLLQHSPTISAAEMADHALLLGQQTAFLYYMCSSVHVCMVSTYLHSEGTDNSFSSNTFYCCSFLQTIDSR